MQPNTTSQKKTGIVIGIVVAFLVVLVTFFSMKNTSQPAAVATQNPSAGTAPTAPVAPTQPSTPVDTTKPTVSEYKDGTYTAVGSYMSPGGPDQVTVTVTLANDVITDATVASGAGDRTSARYQQRFISGFKQYVVGQKIQSVNLTNVSGSSLTPVGFNDALAQIKQQARA